MICCEDCTAGTELLSALSDLGFEITNSDAVETLEAFAAARVAREREAAAKMCDEIADNFRGEGLAVSATAVRRCAARIREGKHVEEREPVVLVKL